MIKFTIPTTAPSTFDALSAVEGALRGSTPSVRDISTSDTRTAPDVNLIKVEVHIGSRR